MKTKRTWAKLDNAAKIFPPTSNNKDPKVFRFSCELYEDVKPEYLQRALDLTIKRFPFYRSILKKGLFWYYFEETRLRPVITAEDKPPCSPIYDPNYKDLLFRVSYYKKRINLEVFHALSDGTGALQFIKVLVINYLNLRHKDDKCDFKLPKFDASASQMTIDSFSKYFSNVKVKRVKAPKAYRYRGEKYANLRMGIIELIVPVDKVMAASKNKQTTVTQYLLALLFGSIGENMSNREKKFPVTVSLPVNLRGFFPSKTSRNFFSVINVVHDFEGQGGSIDQIANSIKDSLTHNLKKNKLQDTINLFASLENKLPAKLLPLFIKIPSLKIANIIANRAVTAGLSNVGKIDMPDGTEKYIRLFSVFNSTQKIQVTMCSYKNEMAITFTTPFVNNDIQCSYIDMLNEAGIDVKVNTNIDGIGL